MTMKTAKLGDYFLWEGKVVKCEWINEGYRSIGFYAKRIVTCPACGREHEIEEGYNIIESSPQFQDNALGLNTITG